MFTVRNCDSFSLAPSRSQTSTSICDFHNCVLPVVRPFYRLTARRGEPRNSDTVLTRNYSPML